MHFACPFIFSSFFFLRFSSPFVLFLPHSLRQLMLSNTKVTDEGLLQLSQLVRLKILYLDRTTVSDAGITVVRGKNHWSSHGPHFGWCCFPLSSPPPFFCFFVVVDLCES